MFVHRFNSYLAPFMAFVVTASTLGGPVIAHANDDDDDNRHQQSTEVRFSNHLELSYPLQDVFVQSSADASKVVRVTPPARFDAALRAQALFAATTPVAHDYYKGGIAPLGPFDKGLPLQITLDKWLTAAGSGSYQSDGNSARLDLGFTGLVPFGDYTVWCNQITFPPGLSITTKPCGMVDGMNNMFMANATGEAKFAVNLAPLPKSTAHTTTFLSVVYHSDRVTHGDRPGDFGFAAHEQLMFFFPLGTGTIPPPPGDKTCIQAAITARDTALVNAFQTYSSSIVVALQTRSTALSAAWGISDKKERTKAVNTAWNNFAKSRRDARTALNKAQQNIWKEFNSDRKDCKEPNADAGRQGHDNW